MYKKIISAILTLAIFSTVLFSGVMSVNASEEFVIPDSHYEYFENYYADYMGDEKRYNAFTMDDDFADDTVLVTFFHRYSEVNKEYAPEYFNIVSEGILFESVTDLTRIKDISRKNETLYIVNFYH